jgi:hypothetical protein
MTTGDGGGGAIVSGHRDKYALAERERRFLLAAPPSGARLTDERQITDRYLTGTRLRLRRVTRAGSRLGDESPSGVVRSDPDVLSSGGGPPGSAGRRAGSRGEPVTGAALAEPELKLTQKVPADRPGPVSGLITNFYLSQAEYELLATLPAAELTKTRLSFPPYVVDVFGPPCHGLFLAEVEMHTDADLAACPPPPGSVAEVTSDARFTGGRLAVTRRPELLAWLAEYGLTVQDHEEASDRATAALPRSPRTHRGPGCRRGEAPRPARRWAGRPPRTRTAPWRPADGSG